jgi:hypothetical protein
MNRPSQASVTADADELPPFPLDPERLVEVLARHEVEYILVGGSALIIHGIGSRETYDLDIVPSAGEDNLERLGGALRELGAKVVTHWSAADDELHVDESTFEPAVFRDNPFLHLVTPAGRLDVILRPGGADGGFDELAPGAVRARLGNVDLAISGVPDLIRMKEATGRMKDREDLRAIEAQRRDELHRRNIERDGGSK